MKTIRPLLSGDDLHLFNEGTHCRIYEKLGAHPRVVDGIAGTEFSVWAPNAERVTVIGDFNGWNNDADDLHPLESSGIWRGFIPDVGHTAAYKYYLNCRGGYRTEKADPFGFHHETPPKTASKVWDISDYRWNDSEWMNSRAERQTLQSPISIYEVHLGSWLRIPEQGNRWLSYREIAPKLAQHVKSLGFTHVEFLPIMEHPFYGSWGYQVTGYFAPTSRFGTPQDFMFLVDHLHANGIGVILDWVPAHFPNDGHGLAYFDGTHLYEHADSRKGFHPDWKSCIFNYGRHEVCSFLLSSAVFWLDKYHIDGLRVDGVASMLYLDYSRKEGEWIPNEYGGRENIEAIELLRSFNQTVYREYPDVQTYAEESTAWPAVSRPVYVGGLGFGFKWDMGWMHDTLKYMERDPIHRQYHHDQLTFRAIYQFNENFVMPLSHDEVVHGKGSLLDKMPGDFWQKFANLRLLLAYMYAQSGKKLLFMGAEFAQWDEWKHDFSLDWHLVQYKPHMGVQTLVSQLNRLYRNEPAMHELDADHTGFRWVNNDPSQSIMAFARRGKDPRQQIWAIFNLTPVVRLNYRIGVPNEGGWHELLNTDAHEFGGSGQGNWGRTEATPIAAHGYPFSVNLTLPPLAALFLKAEIV